MSLPCDLLLLGDSGSIIKRRRSADVLSGILLLMASLVVVADEVSPPEFKNPPLEYTNRHDIAYRWDNDRLEQVNDLLLIGDITDKKLTFYVSTIGNNYHMCHVTGDAKKEGDHYLFSYQQCQLQIKFDARKATVSDATGQCQKHFCGMMGSIQGEFKKK